MLWFTFNVKNKSCVKKKEFNGKKNTLRKRVKCTFSDRQFTLQEPMPHIFEEDLPRGAL